MKSRKIRAPQKRGNPEKALLFLVILLLLVSFSGLFVSLGRLGRIRMPSITGFGTTDLGRVNVSVEGLTSIIVNDGWITFGSCTPTTGGLTVSTNGTDNTACTGDSFPDHISIENNGNSYVNVTVKSTFAGDNSSFIGGTNASFWYTSINRTPVFNSGCGRSYCGQGVPNAANCTTDGSGSATSLNCTWPMDWVSFAEEYVEYPICKNLSYDPNNDNVSMWAKIYIPPNAPVRGNRTAVLTFTAAALTTTHCG